MMMLLLLFHFLLNRGMTNLTSFFAFLLFFITLMLLLHSTEAVHRKCQNSSFHCGNLGNLSFPFSNYSNPHCGLSIMNCEEPIPQIQLIQGGRWYDVLQILTPNTIRIRDWRFDWLLTNRSCAFSYFNLPNTPSISYTVSPNLTLFNCTHLTSSISDYHTNNCSLYYRYPNNETLVPATPSPNCSVLHLPMVSPDMNPNPHPDDLFELLASNFSLELHVSEDCLQCYNQRGQCRTDDENKFYCRHDKEGGSKSRKVILATVISGGAILLICLAVFLVRCGKNWKLPEYFPLYLRSRYTSDLSSKPNREDSSVYFGVSVFSYTELEEATNNFDPSKELGEGGFGTVYHGKLRDGKEVAVKRLYEHNYKRMEQFMNEIEILTRLRHKNLVTLYGCTSRYSHGLLLVYEYIPNGTVADHIHIDRTKTGSGSLTWPIRMNIAIETANALAYLHASDIIHRDVKTNNILLDNNFSVKVADFGLSRFFPINATHVSTAPQGTAGYVDPEYHQCYQLTNKSDVYSFGVVLIELVSSMPAVDTSRHRHEINLANLAINKIQRRALHELIDPSLGFESDATVWRMTTSVAELAFRCLQLEKEMRPTMDEVLEALMEIQGIEDCRVEKIEEVNDNLCVSRSIQSLPMSPESEDVVLVKSTTMPHSPNSVADIWISSSTTTNISW